MAAGTGQNPNQSISRAIEVLHFVADNPGSSLGQIAKATGLARSTVQRLVAVLNAEGFITKNFGQQGVYLGMEVARLAAKVHLDARILLMPLMQELHATVGGNLDLTTYEHGKVVVIEQIASHEAIRVISYVGKQHPIHCTANGKAHLSLLSNDEAMAAMGPRLRKYTSRTVTDRRQLLQRIEAGRRSGLFVDEEEYSEGACAVATVLPEIGGRSLAIAIAMPTHQYRQKVEAVKAALLKFRAKVKRTYGSSI